MPPTDRLLEARKTYAEIAEASQSLGTQAASLRQHISDVTERVAALRIEVAGLVADLDRERVRVRDTADQVAADADKLRWAVRQLWPWVIVLVFVGAIMGDIVKGVGLRMVDVLWTALTRLVG